MDNSKQLIFASLFGVSTVGMLYFYNLANGSEDEIDGNVVYLKEQYLKDVFQELKAELKAGYPIDAPRDREDGLFTRDFFIKIHELMYKYKKNGFMLIEDANFKTRVFYLRQIEELKEMQADEETEKSKAEIQKKY